MGQGAGRSLDRPAFDLTVLGGHLDKAESYILKIWGKR